MKYEGRRRVHPFNGGWTVFDLRLAVGEPLDPNKEKVMTDEMTYTLNITVKGGPATFEVENALTQAMSMATKDPNVTNVVFETMKEIPDAMRHFGGSDGN